LSAPALWAPRFCLRPGQPEPARRPSPLRHWSSTGAAVASPGLEL